MGIYDNVLAFKGNWRTYQKRVLDNADSYLKNGKVHIVAAPGSGKTTLGIELIRRLGNPCLILSPSITIRQQWLSRIQEGFFMEGVSASDWLSNDIRDMKPITAITYQALHSCMKKLSGEIEDDEDEDNARERETADFRDFDIYPSVHAAGIRTICLDEAHHLRSEWWKALEEFLKNMPGVTLISLTATPPYDSTPAQWKRYIDLCGPIDEEIFTPELVKEKSLCPHQDYIFFNMPTREEQAAVKEFTVQADMAGEKIKKDPEFSRCVASHRGILAPEQYGEIFLENPKYFSSILIFLHENHIPFSPYLTELTGTSGRFPKLDNYWLEALLQGFLFDDTDAYACDNFYREQMIQELKQAGCIRRNKVQLVKNDAVEKLLVKSRGKLHSISRIIQAEYGSLGDRLRLLVLCDFIKKECLPSVGNADKISEEIGAIPIFEHVRRENFPGLKLGVLTGSVIIVPEDTWQELQGILTSYGCEGYCVPLRGTGYGAVSVKGNGNHIVEAVTRLFSAGRIHALIGTKSLLGEGWDSPCINSLILATYVGSFMLSNQMRGRAIRVWKDDAFKTSNIWHLACILPQEGTDGQGLPLGDYETLSRRFDAFLGVSYEEDLIESGLGRLGLKSPPMGKREIEAFNERTMKKAGDRDGLRAAWEKSLHVVYNDMGVEEIQEMDKGLTEPGFVFVNAVAMTVFWSIIAVLDILARVFLQTGFYRSSLLGAAATALLVLSLFGMGYFGFRVIRFCTPQKRMQRVAECMLKALEKAGKLEAAGTGRAVTEEAEGLVLVYLKGGTTRDKTLFAACQAQFWGVIDNPRYVLKRKGKKRKGEYYAVPEEFGRRKEDAELFACCMHKALGPSESVYTRTPEGRKLLLRARTRSFVNRNDRIIRGKKQVKSDFE